MISLSFSSSEIEELRHQRFHHPHPHVQKKMEALLLKSHDLPHQQIADIVGVCENTLRSYFVEFQDGGIDRLKEIRFYCPSSDLLEFEGTLETHFTEQPPASAKEAADRIEKITGIKRGLTQARKFMKSMGLKLRKVGFIPAKADVEKQKVFLEQELDPALKEAREGKRSVFFVDAAHFVHAPFLGFLWSFKRIFVRAPSGRKRFNVLGALNAVTRQVLMVTNQSYINAESVCTLLRQITEQVTGSVTLVLDNARYQKCFLVQELAKSLQIELLYLPSYSPNLNLIERLWKFVKKGCLNSRYYPDFISFHTTIATFLADMNQKHQKELESLLTHNFQTFENMAMAT